MKSRVFATFSLLSLLTAASAFAGVGDTLNADIPFAFHVGSAVLPAGHYEVVPQSAPNLVEIQCLSCKTQVMVPVQQASGQTSLSKGQLVFHRDGNAYFLSTIETAGSSQIQHLQSVHAPALAR